MVRPVWSWRRMNVSCHSDVWPSPGGDGKSRECVQMSETLLTKKDAAERLNVSQAEQKVLLHVSQRPGLTAPCRRPFLSP